MTDLAIYTGRKGDYIQVHSGKRVYLLDLKPEDFDIEDIAHSLSMTCRYTGHCNFFYPVAQHVVLGSRKAPPEHKYEFLMHDNSEAYLADVARPVKGMLPDYKRIEHGLEIVLALRFGLPPFMTPAVKRLDTQMLITEAPQLMNGDPWWLGEQYADFKPLDIKIKPWSPARAKREFLAAYHRLKGDRA